MTSEKPWPILMHPSDVIGMKEAEDISGRDARTIRRWCVEHGIGYQSGKNAPWEISGPGLVMVRHGDVDGLELLRSGNREHPRVRRVLDYLNLGTSM